MMDMNMSASAISAMIRAKKKKMEDESEAVKLSGIPEDAQDISVIKNHEAGEMLSENSPKERNEDPSLEEQMAAMKAPQPHMEKAEDPHQINQPEDGEVENRKAKMKKMMMRMGK